MSRELSLQNGRKYSEKDERFFTRLVRDGMPKWKVCEHYDLSRGTLYNMMKRSAPNLIGKVGGGAKSRKVKSKAEREPGDGRSNLCPVCSPADPPRDEWDRERRRKWGWEPYTPAVELRHTTNGNGQVHGYCPECGYVEENLAA